MQQLYNATDPVAYGKLKFLTCDMTSFLSEVSLSGAAQGRDGRAPLGTLSPRDPNSHGPVPSPTGMPSSAPPAPLGPGHPGRAPAST